MYQYSIQCMLKSICVEFDLHNVVILNFVEIHIVYHWIPCYKKRFYLYVVELVSSNQLLS